MGPLDRRRAVAGAGRRQCRERRHARMTGRLVVAGLLLAHGLIHLAFVAPRPAPTPGGPPWPFDLGQSWLLAQLGVSADLARILGLALVAATVAGFALAALT